MSTQKVMKQDRVAFDKSLSARSVDEDDHLHITQTNISKATVNPYRGSEIPNAEQLGLEPNRIYKLLRDPKELAKGAATFNNKPLLDLHKPQTAATHDHELTVGTVSNPRFVHPYLKADMAVWEAAAIAGIDKDEVKQLSSSYRYDADMTPGEYEGQAYDGVMRNIRCNHVALVEEGRAGPDVIVADGAMSAHDWSKAFGKMPWPRFGKHTPKFVTQKRKFK